MHEVFWEAQQNADISRARSVAQQAKDRTDRIERNMMFLERRVERLSIACQALWELLRETTDLADEQVVAKMQEIDLRDGEADGKITRRPLKCVSCGHVNNSGRKNCLYCEAELEREHLFE
ncbi:MAG: hypothetical protein OHK0029_19160 [Armatimonadaceae bacterium]